MIFSYNSVKELYQDIDRLQEIEGVDILEEMKVKEASYSFEDRNTNLEVYAKGIKGTVLFTQGYISVDCDTLGLDINDVEYIELNTNKMGILAEIKIEFAHNHFMYLYF